MPYIYYKLITNKYYSPYDSCQCSDFSSMIKRKGRVYVDTHDPIYFDINISFDENEKYIYKRELKDKIAKEAGIPRLLLIYILIHKNILMKVKIIFQLKITFYII